MSQRDWKWNSGLISLSHVLIINTMYWILKKSDIYDIYIDTTECNFGYTHSPTKDDL